MSTHAPVPGHSVSWDDVYHRCSRIADHVVHQVGHDGPGISVFGVPRGGLHIANMVVSILRGRGHCARCAESPQDNSSMGLLDPRPSRCVIVDDLVDSGRTRDYWKSQFPEIPFLTAFDKQQNPDDMGRWLSFPWERAEALSGPEDNVVRLLQFIGEDVTRDGLKETPARVVKSFREIYGGYSIDVSTLMKCFDAPAYDEMVLLRNVEFYSTCEHHLQPFFGRAHIAYIPDKRVIGVSKLARLLEAYSRRLQIQERLTSQVTAALDEHLVPKGSACILEAQHFCMVCRGVQKQNASMVTSSLTGCFREPAARAELFNLIRQ